ncbi:Uncharacterized protein OS=Gloeobacter kilaueensis JS1 GN=GKIL_1802 PE=4 SV=1 [Gemmata massiliana]|uniref:DUF4261 domain-containing protein n=1 Tax=Gemmata massiliana TaxID=1210884 RepID=A0A6P2D120_9BACT|nr:hypothetical protein [Gemmata massiliana]VTR93784.1 Uncharacterized protein OS=Gloeobacter kilaueensis JS1 GN=GKIL_1802 PE=4 SV=1 [Gemmata massiliana]
MATDNALVPVFVPPLATLLAHAEKLKGTPLTEAEVERVRDHAICVMMRPSAADDMTASRGYCDVEPENCWADWHRLRVELTGNGYLPKILLCLVGGADFPAKAQPILDELGLQYEFAPRDERMAKAFESSSFRVSPTLKPADFARIAQHESVLYVFSKNFSAREAPNVSQKLLQAGARLLDATGFAMKCESSGIAHSSARWQALAKQADDPSDRAEFWTGLFDAFVAYPIQSKGDFYSCGMHLLGKPDLITATDLAPVKDAVELFRAFAMYLLVECPDGEFASGHTFSASAATPRYRVAWEPCTGYDEDDFFFNPFGRWRFTAS